MIRKEMREGDDEGRKWWEKEMVQEGYDEGRMDGWTGWWMDWWRDGELKQIHKFAENETTLEAKSMNQGGHNLPNTRHKGNQSHGEKAQKPAADQEYE